MNIHAENYVVLNGAGNIVVEEENRGKKQNVTSISKIMTAAIIIEHGQLDESFTVDDKIDKAYGSGIYLKRGQQVTVQDPLCGLMLRSGNDAAVEAVKHITDSQETFIELANHRATETGMSSAIFSSPSGLDEEDEDNISTANNMAVLMSYAVKNKELRTTTSSEYYTTDWNMRWRDRSRSLFDYPFTADRRIGLTKKAGRTLMSVAEHDGAGSIVVTLRGGNDFTFHEQEHTEVFQRMDVVAITCKGDYMVDGRKFHVPGTLKATLHKGGSDKLRVRTHYDHEDFATEVQKGDDVSVYSLASKEVRGGGLFS